MVRARQKHGVGGDQMSTTDEKAQAPRKSGPGAAIGEAVALFLTGASVGTLVGLSATPVVEAVITTLLALAITAATIAAGIKRAEGDAATPPSGPLRAFNVWAVSAFSVGLAMGSIGGVLLRTHHTLAPSPEWFAERWKATQTPDAGVLETRLLDTLYPAAGGKDAKDGKDARDNKAAPGVLYSAPGNDVCDELMLASDANLKTVVTGIPMGDTERARLKTITGDWQPERLRNWVKTVCATSPP
jgi:hypothetical protein